MAYFFFDGKMAFGKGAGEETPDSVIVIKRMIAPCLIHTKVLFKAYLQTVRDIDFISYFTVDMGGYGKLPFCFFNV